MMHSILVFKKVVIILLTNILKICFTEPSNAQLQ